MDNSSEEDLFASFQEQEERTAGTELHGGSFPLIPCDEKSAKSLQEGKLGTLKMRFCPETLEAVSVAMDLFKVQGEMFNIPFQSIMVGSCGVDVFFDKNGNTFLLDDGEEEYLMTSIGVFPDEIVVSIIVFTENGQDISMPFTYEEFTKEFMEGFKSCEARETFMGSLKMWVGDIIERIKRNFS